MKKNPREGNHQGRHQDVRREHGRIGWLSVIVKVPAWILHSSKVTTDPVIPKVELECGGTVRGFDRLFLSQISFSHRGRSCCCLVHTSWSRRANWWGDCDVQQSSYVSDGTDKRELLWERAFGLKSSWGGQLTDISAHLPRKGKKLGDGLGGNPGFHERETWTALDLGWRHQREVLWIDRLSSCGRVKTDNENADGHERCFARTSVTRCCGRPGLDGDEHMDGRKLRTGTVHTKQLDRTWGRTDANGLHHDLEETGSKTGASDGLRLVQAGPHGGACCSFVASGNEILCRTWSEFAWLEAMRLLARSGHQDVDRVGKIGM